MDAKNKCSFSAEADYVGRFLLQLYHRRLFANNGKIEKCVVRREFGMYSNKHPLPVVENVKVVSLLLRNKFLFNAKSTTKANIFVIHMVTFRQYFNDLLKRLDEAQKREMLKRVTIDKPLGEFKEAEKLAVDPNFKEEMLKFQANYKEIEDKDFILTSKGCCICQKNFKLEIDYIDHIEYHNQESNFESLRSRSGTLIQFMRISYQMCKDSSYLRFCIESLHSDLRIFKVVIVRDGSMLYPQESETPYSLVAGEQSCFYIDCHTFEIGYEQPIVIVFKDEFSTDVPEMRIEQHHFLRMEPFKVDITSVINTYIPKRGELKCSSTLKSYFPPKSLKESEMETIYKSCPKFIEYERSKKVVNQENIEDIYKLLVQLEDTAILDLYDKLTQKATIITNCGEYFSVWLKLDHDINVEDILKEGDKVELVPVDSGYVNRPSRRYKGSGNQKIWGYIEQVFKKRIIFSVRHSQLIKPEELYDIKFLPLRYHLILQYRAFELLRGLRDVKKILFPTKRWYINEKLAVSISPFNNNLAKNPEQLEAVERIVHHMDPEAPYIIFGPPGTGKTTTIVEAIYQLWKNNPKNRILVVGGSNACVDEIAIRMIEVFKDVDPMGKNMLRIYSSAQGRKSEHIDERLIRISNLCHGYQFYPCLEIVYMYPIVFATLSIAAKYVHGGIAADHFSHVFVDECGASTEPEVIAALIGTVTHKTKVVLAGDPKQLGPVLQSKTADELGLGISLLERLMNSECYQTEALSKIYDRSRQIRLTKNYRTHPSILNMSNQLYYENDLEACGENSVTSWALNWYKLPSPNFPVIFHAVKGKSEKRNGSQSLYNWAEMIVVMNYIKEIMYFGINGRQMEQGEIGIVTPYKSQVNLIRTELDARKWFEIEVGSVEKFQGQERPVIVFSTVRSQMSSLGFLVSPKRLNVSLTRAQALLIIVGNPETLSANADFNYVINYCKDNGAFKGEKYSLSRCSSSSNLSTVSINDYLRNDFNNLSISNGDSGMQETNKQVQNLTNGNANKNDFLQHEFKNDSQIKKHIPTAQVQPLRNIHSLAPHKKVGDWLDDCQVPEKKASREYNSKPQHINQEYTKTNTGFHNTTNVQNTNMNSRPTSGAPIRVTDYDVRKTHPVQPMAAVYSPTFSYPAFNNTNVAHSANAAPHPIRTNVTYVPTYGQSSSNNFQSINLTHNSQQASGSEGITRMTGMSSPPVQSKPSETARINPMLHRNIRDTEFWRNEEKNLNSVPAYVSNYNTSKSQPALEKVTPTPGKVKPVLKKDNACVIL